MSVPAATPVTTPVDASTVAKTTFVLLHTPPVVASLSVVVAAGHTTAVPVMAPAVGVVSMVTTAVAMPVPQLVVTV